MGMKTGFNPNFSNHAAGLLPWSAPFAFEIPKVQLPLQN
jgi:hypothetical protein